VEALLRRDCSKERGSNRIHVTFRDYLIILAENLDPTAPSPLPWRIDHTTIGRPILSLDRKRRGSKADLRKEVKARLDVLCGIRACLSTDIEQCVHPHSWSNGCHQSARLLVQKSKSVADDTGSV
jgi:hypothetical protein